MPHPGNSKSKLELDNTLLAHRFRKSVTCGDNTNKPDFKELDLGSPVSPLLTKPTGLLTCTSTSSSSSGSLSGPNPLPKKSEPGNKNHSGELSGSVNSPSLNVLPTGNICPSGKVLKTASGSAITTRNNRSDVLGSGTGNYGHGSIIRSGKSGTMEVRPNLNVDPEALKRAGNEHYKRGHFGEALSLYDRAIAVSPENAAYHCNRAAALMGLKRLTEAVRECEEAIKLDGEYVRAHHRLGSLLLSLGQVENARRHLCFPGHQPDPMELQKLEAVEKHLSKCTSARRIGDWASTLRECDAAIASGADASPQLFTCRAEALLKLRQLDDADLSLTSAPKFETSSSHYQAKFFGMLSEAYPFFVRAQIEMALGRFENAVTAVEKAGKVDPRNVEVSVLVNTVRLVARARAHGNDLFKSERFTEACSAYGEGLRFEPSNSVLFCNRAACWYKLGQWEQSLDDCNEALRIQPKYTKALLRRAASNSKLERWAEAVSDYEILRKELRNDKDVSECLFHAEVALKKSQGEVHNLKFGGEVELISGLEQFRTAISSPGPFVVHFKVTSNQQCKQISPFYSTLCSQYPSINFLKVDVEESPAIANAENVRSVPTFKIYKEGRLVKEMVCPRLEVLESSVKHYNNNTASLTYKD